MLKIEPPADRRAARRKTHRVRRAARARSQIAIYISTGAPECCVFVCQSQFRKAVTRFRDSAANTIFIEKRRSFPRACAGDKPPTRSLRSDPQCFSHEDGCFAPFTNHTNSLPELPPTAISDQVSEPLPTPTSNQTRYNEVSRTYENQFTRFRHVFHNFGPINTQFLHIYFRKYDL